MLARLALAAGAFSAAVLSAAGEEEWNYLEMGPQEWGGLCAEGKEQSPINLSTLEATETTAGTIADVMTPATAKFNVTQAHGAPTYSCAEKGTCGSLEHDGTKFDLLQFHFHALSENTMDGNHYPLEVHFVHADEDGNLAVVGVLFTDAAGDEAMSVAEPIGQLWKYATADGELTEDFDTSSLVPTSSGFFHFDGSLTTPPCSEGVKWFVVAVTPVVDADQAKTFFDIVGYPGNWRPVQPLNERTVEKFTSA